jgi:hypothetical protein
MRKLQLTRVFPILIFTMLLALVSSCDDDNDDFKKNLTDQTLTESDKDALLFMLEEEKLARDTYIYLNDLWSLNTFDNIKNSEQSHMNAVENLLNQYDIDYAILDIGEFANQDLQNFYNQFVIDGAVSSADALQIGATIEDLDIVDLQDNINATSNTAIISVFEKLQCGSRNHLRSFVSSIKADGNSYTPQYLTQEAFDSIIAGSHEQCN